MVQLETLQIARQDLGPRQLVSCDLAQLDTFRPDTPCLGVMKAVPGDLLERDTLPTDMHDLEVWQLGVLVVVVVIRLIDFGGGGDAFGV